MKITNKYIITSLLLIGLISCIGVNKISNDVFVGNFEEKKYEFFESFTFTNEKNFYYELPFALKFGGIRPFPFDSTGK